MKRKNRAAPRCNPSKKRKFSKRRRVFMPFDPPAVSRLIRGQATASFTLTVSANKWFDLRPQDLMRMWNTAYGNNSSNTMDLTIRFVKIWAHASRGTSNTNIPPRLVVQKFKLPDHDLAAGGTTAESFRVNQQMTEIADVGTFERPAKIGFKNLGKLRAISETTAGGSFSELALIKFAVTTATNTNPVFCTFHVGLATDHQPASWTPPAWTFAKAASDRPDGMSPRAELKPAARSVN